VLVTQQTCHECRNRLGMCPNSQDEQASWARTFQYASFTVTLSLTILALYMPSPRQSLRTRAKESRNSTARKGSLCTSMRAPGDTRIVGSLLPLMQGNKLPFVCEPQVTLLISRAAYLGSQRPLSSIRWSTGQVLPD
jgi:hypothetical protein